MKYNVANKIVSEAELEMVNGGSFKDLIDKTSKFVNEQWDEFKLEFNYYIRGIDPYK